MNQRQLQAIDYLREENRVLREQLGGRRVQFTDDQRRRLAVKGRIVGRRWLGEFASAMRSHRATAMFVRVDERGEQGRAFKRRIERDA